MAQIQANPDLVQRAYEQKLADSTREVVLLQAVATELQQQVEELTKENGELKAANEVLMANSGRQDGVPQEPDTAAE